MASMGGAKRVTADPIQDSLATPSPKRPRVISSSPTASPTPTVEYDAGNLSDLEEFVSLIVCIEACTNAICVNCPCSLVRFCVVSAGQFRRKLSVPGKYASTGTRSFE